MSYHVENMLKIGMCKMKNLQNVWKNVLLVVTSKIKHFYNLFTFTACPLEVDGSDTFLQMIYFICNHLLSLTCVQHDKTFGFATFLRMPLHKTFANHFRGDYVQNKTLKHFCKCLILHLTRV